jgi:thiol-disulfide isomerase/thioredoxin
MTKSILLLFVIFICTFIANAQNEFHIKGKLINNTEYKKVYLENIINKLDLDSAIIDSSGGFSINAKIEKPDFFKLRFNEEQYVLLILGPGENIQIEVDGTNMFVPAIKGSPASESVYNTYAKMKEFDVEMQQLSKQIDEKKKEYIRQYILNNLNSLSSLFFIDNLSIDEDIAIYKKLDESLTKLYPDHSLVKNLHDRVKALTLLSIGSLAPEIDMAGLKGKNIKLSSLKGKYVLIDFWAAWCGPCRKESPNMVAIYKDYNKKGFEIYSVSLDNNQKDWETAIKKDGLGAWTHVSDLKYWNNAAAQEYGVDGIPYTVLIDKEGKIIAKGLRGDELKAKLKEIFDSGK